MADPSELAQQAGTLSDAEWALFLDKIDEIARERSPTVPDRPEHVDRDQVAVWLSRRHLSIDTSLREVWYLPENAPADEIRLIEVNDRGFAPDEISPVDMRLNVDGIKFSVKIVDLSSRQLDAVLSTAEKLPEGWSLDRRVKTGRREA